MHMIRGLKKGLVWMLALLLVAGAVVMETPATYAASSGKLVKSVKYYYKKGGKWKKSGSESYKYNSNGDPVVISEKGRGKTQYTIEYTYEDGKKVEAKKYCKEGNESSRLESVFAYDDKERLIAEDSYYDGSNHVTFKYSYGKNDYVSKIKGTYSDQVIKYKWNGNKPKSLAVYSANGGKKYKTDQTTFNKKGYIQKPRCYTQADPDMTYSYKNGKNGLVKTINLVEKDGSYREYRKYVITYTSKNISKKRYRAMINSIVSGDYILMSGQAWY